LLRGRSVRGLGDLETTRKLLIQSNSNPINCGVRSGDRDRYVVRRGPDRRPGEGAEEQAGDGGQQYDRTGHGQPSGRLRFRKHRLLLGVRDRDEHKTVRLWSF
jgi:hypothetical protein